MLQANHPTVKSQRPWSTTRTGSGGLRPPAGSAAVRVSTTRESCSAVNHPQEDRRPYHPGPPAGLMPYLAHDEAQRQLPNRALHGLAHNLQGDAVTFASGQRVRLMHHNQKPS